MLMLKIVYLKVKKTFKPKFLKDHNVNEGNSPALKLQKT